jgi:hypothetical protein
MFSAATSSRLHVISVLHFRSIFGGTSSLAFYVCHVLYQCAQMFLNFFVAYEKPRKLIGILTDILILF